MKYIFYYYKKAILFLIIIYFVSLPAMNEAEGILEINLRQPTHNINSSQAQFNLEDQMHRITHGAQTTIKPSIVLPKRSGELKDSLYCFTRQRIFVKPKTSAQNILDLQSDEIIDELPFKRVLQTVGLMCIASTCLACSCIMLLGYKSTNRE